MKVIPTGDGSNSIFIEKLNETYHSRHGALQESNHVFLKNGFIFLVDNRSYSNIRIFELGFGTGLNAVLTAIESLKRKVMVEYLTVEPYPLPKGIVDQLEYGKVLEHPDASSMFNRIHDAVWEKRTVIHSFFRLNKVKSTIQELNEALRDFDLIYYDAFAPSKQPEMWSWDILEKVHAMMVPGGVFVTYCARGQVKRDLSAMGMVIQTLPGPPGKKEMIRGIKN